jgi:uncharacterized protein
MLHSLFSIKLAAMAAALGLNTAEWSKPSKEMLDTVQKLETAMSGISDPNKAGEVQSSLSEGVKTINELADKGDRDAQYAMGLLSQQSNQQGGVEQAMKYYELAAKQGQLQAMNNYGFILASSSRDQAKAKEGLDWIKKASDAGLNPARRNMARIVLNGMGGDKPDAAAALKLLQAAAAEKDSQAIFELSQFYMGQGGKENQDDQKGLELLNQAADLGNAGALDTLGSLLLQGGKVGTIEVKADPKAAIEKFTKLAEQNSPVGLRKMGGVYESGIAGVEKSFPKALESYSRAAQANDSLAQFRLATMYDTGVDLDPKDDKIELPANAAAALNLFRAASQNNLPIASYYVGLYYELGRTVDKDLTKAFTYFQQAAQAGVPAGMQKVGVYYLNGAGTLKDPIAASGWFARAASAGLPDGHLSYGIITEQGLAPQSDKGSPFFAAADSYLAAADAPAATDAVRMEAFIRLGSLYFRGAMVAKGDAPKPDYERAYLYFKQAVEIDPKNQLAESARSEAVKKLSQDQIKKADADIERMKKDRDARRQKAEAAATAPAGVAPSTSGSLPTAKPVK